MFQSVKYPDKVALKYTCENINQELPVICAGSITKVEDADKALEFGASIVAFGRAAIGNANLPKYFEKGESLPFATPFIVANLKKLMLTISLFIISLESGAIIQYECY